MIALSKHLYIVDELKWSFINAILNKRIKESIFWITEYYESGYKKESWGLLYVVYSCFYFKNYSYYLKKIDKKYKLWLETNNFHEILNIVYRFSKMIKKDFTFFKIFWSGLKCKKVNIKLKTDIYEKYNVTGLYKILLKSLQSKHYGNLWFFTQLNFEKTLNIISKFYNKKFVFKNNEVNDKKVQLIMKIFILNEGKMRSRPNIKITSTLIKFYENIINEDKCESYKILKNKRLYGISKEIGCFNLERYNYTHEELVNNYFYKWEYMANNSKIWNERISTWFGEFDENNNIKFINDDLQEKFYEKYGLEPDEQNKETHNKSICQIKKCIHYKKITIANKIRGLGCIILI